MALSGIMAFQVASHNIRNNSWKEDQTFKETLNHYVSEQLVCEEILDFESRDFQQFSIDLTET